MDKGEKLNTVLSHKGLTNNTVVALMKNSICLVSHLCDSELFENHVKIYFCIFQKENCVNYKTNVAEAVILSNSVSV